MQPDPKAKPDKQLKQLKNLRAAAGQLAEAAKRFKASKKNQGQQNPQNMANKIASLSQKLDQDAQQLEQALQQAQQQAGQNQQNNQDGQRGQAMKMKLAKAQQDAQQSNQAMQLQLRKLGAANDARMRLGQMRSKLSQAQSAVAGQSLNPFESDDNQAGSGSVNSTNDTKTREDGKLEHLTGTKTAGPSQTMVEETQSGTGVSGRRQTSINVEHARQLESFVERPDVPDNLKQGVKTYFQNLHQTPEEPALP